MKLRRSWTRIRDPWISKNKLVRFLPSGPVGPSWRIGPARIPGVIVSYAGMLGALCAGTALRIGQAGPEEMTTMFTRWVSTAVVLVIFSGVGYSGTSEYNHGGRDMYGNTPEQNEADRLRGAREKDRFARENKSGEKAENDDGMYALIPGAALLTALALGGAVVARRWS
jgi:hypothetical protein